MQSDEEDDDDALVPGMDVSEVRHTAKRSQKEELRCVLAVVRHGGAWAAWHVGRRRRGHLRRLGVVHSTPKESKTQNKRAWGL